MRTERSEQSSFVCGERELHPEHSLLGGAFPDAKKRKPNIHETTFVAGPHVGGGAEENRGSELGCQARTSLKLVLSQDFVRFTNFRRKRVPKTRRVSQ